MRACAEKEDACLFGTAPPLLPHHFFQSLALCQLVYQFIEVTHLLEHRVGNVLYPVAADHTGDFVGIGVKTRGLLEKSGKVCFPVDLLLQQVWRVTGEPADDLVEFVFAAAFFFHFFQVQRVHAGETHFMNTGQLIHR